MTNPENQPLSTASSQACMALWWRGEVAVPAEKLLAWATGHRLLPLLAWRVAQINGELPSPLAKAARRARYQNAAQHALARQQLVALGEIAQRLDLPVVLVKGAAVAEAYPEPWMRAYNDIDVLVPPSGANALLRALRARGYTSKTPGFRTTHLPPLQPPQAGLRIEIHTDLSRRPGEHHFAFARWQDRLVPWEAAPGLWVPDPVAHAAYLLYHAVTGHGLSTGLLPLADFRFWMEGWESERWRALAQELASLEMMSMARLGLALTAWFWDQPWPAEVQALFPAPPPEVLEAAQRVAGGEWVQRMPHLWRDLPSRDLRSVLRYAGLILLGDPAQRRALSWWEKVQFYVNRPFRLLRNHGPTLWRLLSGERRSRDAWGAQRILQEWMDGA